MYMHKWFVKIVYCVNYSFGMLVLKLLTMTLQSSDKKSSEVSSSTIDEDQDKSH